MKELMEKVVGHYLPFYAIFKRFDGEILYLCLKNMLIFIHYEKNFFNSKNSSLNFLRNILFSEKTLRSNL